MATIYFAMIVPSLCICSFLLYGWDKRRAQKDQFRVPEVTLHIYDTLGGWPGGLLAMQVFRHKRRKMRFILVMVAGIIVNIAAIIGCSQIPFLHDAVSILLNETMKYILVGGIILATIVAFLNTFQKRWRSSEK